MNITKSKLGIALAGVLALTVLPGRNHASPPQYSVLDLGTLGGTVSRAYGVNASGQVAGSSNLTVNRDDSHTVRWTGAVPTDLGGSDAYGINASGQVAGGVFSLVSGTQSAVRWTGTNLEVLSNLGGDNSFGRNLNASGQVAGYSQLPGNSIAHAVRWTGTTPTDLGTLGGDWSAGIGINDSGQVAGSSSTAGNSASHAVRWTGMTMEDLGTLGGTDSFGFGINASGQVAGFAQTAGNLAYHAVRWTGATAEDLGTLGEFSFGYGINSAGDVTGVYYGAGSEHPFLYTDGAMYDLSSLLLPTSGVTDLIIGNVGNSINDIGQIAAWGKIGGQTHALLLTPVRVPEPSSGLLLLGSGWLWLLKGRHRPRL